MERERSSEERDQLSRSIKKMKRKSGDSSTGEIDLESTRAMETDEQALGEAARRHTVSYRDTLQRNNPNLHFDTRDNPIWVDTTAEDSSNDDEAMGEDDPLCPTILLTAAEKRALREPWHNALIIRMFDKGIGYLQLKRNLKSKWALRGDFSLIDIGCDYYVTRFTNMEDYDHVMLNGPWMIGDNYLVIREWVPNFVPEEDTITKLTAWVRIPKLSVEYFNKNFLLYKIGQKIGRVIKIDSTTENVERGQYTRLCVEVDLTKPLLSKFRLNGRVWGIQYEGLKMICFKCGRQGHKEESCGLEPQTVQDNLNAASHAAPNGGGNIAQQESIYGSWMLVKKPPRRSYTRQQPVTTRGRAARGDPNNVQPRMGSTRAEHEKASENIPASPRSTPPLAAPQNQGSRFRALADLDLNMDTETNEAECEGDLTPVIRVETSPRVTTEIATAAVTCHTGTMPRLGETMNRTQQNLSDKGPFPAGLSKMAHTMAVRTGHGDFEAPNSVFRTRLAGEAGLFTFLGRQLSGPSGNIELAQPNDPGPGEPPDARIPPRLGLHGVQVEQLNVGHSSMETQVQSDHSEDSTPIGDLNC